MNAPKGLLHNLSILAVGQVVSQLANVAALVFMADLLGPHQFGVIQIGVAFMGYALIVAEWGMMPLGIREISRMDTSQRIFTYASEHCGLLSIQALAVLGLGLAILPKLPFYHYDEMVFLLYLATIIPQIYTQSWVAVGLERMTWVSISRITRSLVYALLVFLVLPHMGGVAGMEIQQWVPAIFLMAMITSNLTVNIPLARWFGKFIHPRLPAFSEGRRRWGQASSIGASNLVIRVLFSIDIIMLGVLVSPEIAGNYAAAAKVMFVLVIAVEVLWAALLPRLSRLANESRSGFRSAFNLYFGTVSATLLPIALGGWLLGDEFVAFLYKGKFNEAGPIFEVLAISYAMLALGTFLGNTLLSEDRQKWYLLPLVASSLTAVTAIWLLVPVHGGLGASWSVFIAHGMLLIFLAIVNLKNFNRLMVQTMVGIMPALLAMYFVLKHTSGWHVLLQIMVGGIVYFLLAFWPVLRLRRRSYFPVSVSEN